MSSLTITSPLALPVRPSKLQAVDILDRRNPPTSVCGQILSLIYSLNDTHSTTTSTSTSTSNNSTTLNAYIPLTSYPLPIHVPLIISHINTLTTPFSYNPSSLPPTLPSPVITCLTKHGGIGGLLTLFHTLNYTQSVSNLLSILPDIPTAYVNLYESVALTGTLPSNYMSQPLSPVGLTTRSLCGTHGSFIANLLEWRPGDLVGLLSDDRGDVYNGLRRALHDCLDTGTPVPLVGMTKKIGEGNKVVVTTAIYEATKEAGSKEDEWRGKLMEVVNDSDGTEDGDGELWVRMTHECVGEKERIDMVKTGVKWGKEGWDFIVRSKEHVERQTWDMYVDEIRREMKEGNTKGWGVEGVVYEEGVRGGYTWMEDDKQEIYDAVRGDLEGLGSGSGLIRAVNWVSSVGNDPVMEAWIRIARNVGGGMRASKEDGDVVLKEMGGRRKFSEEGGAWIEGGEEERIRMGFMEGQRGNVWVKGVFRRNEMKKCDA